MTMNKRHKRTLEKILHRPILGTIPWKDIEKLLEHLGADKSEREGSRVAFTWNGEVQVFHRPHPEPVTDKGAVASVKAFIERHYTI